MRFEAVREARKETLHSIFTVLGATKKFFAALIIWRERVVLFACYYRDRSVIVACLAAKLREFCYCSISSFSARAVTDFKAIESSPA
jgi:hypothetical protein